MQITTFEIKEWHFHVYFYQNNKKSMNEAYKLRNNLIKLINENYFWKAFSWFTLNRKDLSILIHPLTSEEKKDHDERSVWMGKQLPLDLDMLKDKTEKIKSQYPDLNLGYN